MYKKIKALEEKNHIHHIILYEQTKIIPYVYFFTGNKYIYFRTLLNFTLFIHVFIKQYNSC